MILRLKIAVLFAHRRMRHLSQYRIEMTIGSRGFTATPFASAFMIARTATCPRSKVLVTGESIHVGSGFRQQRPSTPLAHSRYRIELLDGATKRGGRYRPQPLANTRDLLFQKVVLIEQLAQQKTMVIVDLSLQRTLQLRNLIAQP